MEELESLKHESKSLKRSLRITRLTVVFIFVIIILFVVFALNYFVLVLPLIYICHRISSRLTKENEESIIYFYRTFMYPLLFFLSIISVNYNETHNINITSAFTEISASLADAGVLCAAAIALIEWIDSAIKYYDIKKGESPLYVSDFCWYARHLSILLVLPFLLFAKALQLNVLTGYLFGIGFLIIVAVLSHLLILLVKKNVDN